MSFWNQFKFKKKPFKEPSAEKKDALKIKELSRTAKEKEGADLKKPKIKKAVEKKIDEKKTEKKPQPKKKEETGDAYRVLIRPLISEKVTMLGGLNQYVFEISGNTNKSEVKKAIKNVYGVMPIKIRIVNVSGKRVRFGRNFGKLKDRKKAIITLKKGETIQIYEGI